MPLNVRAKGVSLSTATNWAFNWIVGEMTPYLQERIEWRLYPMHGFFCVCSFVLVYFRELDYVFTFAFYFCLIAYLPCATVYPETKGVPLEEMDTVFGEGAFYYYYLLKLLSTSTFPLSWLYQTLAAVTSELREEQLDDESEEAVSFLQRRRRPRRDSDGEKSTSRIAWVSRLFGSGRRPRDYQPIAPNA